jgi:hypothetical protein
MGCLGVLEAGARRGLIPDLRQAYIDLLRQGIRSTLGSCKTVWRGWDYRRCSRSRSCDGGAIRQNLRPQHVEGASGIERCSRFCWAVGCAAGRSRHSKLLTFSGERITGPS